jgi:hypothetical protein
LHAKNDVHDALHVTEPLPVQGVLKFKWKEREGPPAVAPTRRGFGTSLLKTIFTDVRIDYLAEGLTCEIDLLLDRAQSGRTSRSPAAQEIRPVIRLSAEPTG